MRPAARRAGAGGGRAALVPLVVALAACGRGPAGAPPPLQVQVQAEGRAERGSTLVVRALDDGAVLDPAEVRWSADPGGAAEFLPGGRVRLLKAGAVALTARAGGRAGTLTAQVQRPPTIVLEMLAAGNRDIYRAALDGGELVRLTTATADDRTPTVAAGTVVFASARTGNSELYSVPLAGGTARRLTTSAASEADPALSPDGRRLAFSSDAGGLPRLWLSDAEGGGAVRATPGSGFDGPVEAGPSWAPAGDRLAFMSTIRGTADVFQLALGSGIATPITGGGGAKVEPAWSPDGRAVAFAADLGGDTEIYLLVLGTSVPTRLTFRPGTDGQPAWLPDGRLVFTAWVDGVPRLRWLDVAAPSAVFDVPLPAASNATAAP